MGQLINIADIKALYPNEWVLLGNPIMDDSKIDVLSGIPLFHSKDKKEVCYIGRDKTSNFDKITLIYTGTFRPTRKITGIFNRIFKMTYKFKREPESGLIVVNIEIDNKYELKMILDTGATNTTIDSNALYLLGHDLKDNIGTVELIETANGIIETEVFEIDTFASLGLTKEKFQIQVYDFLAHGIFSDYNGLLGLDFLEGTKFCIDTRENTITLS